MKKRRVFAFLVLAIYCMCGFSAYRNDDITAYSSYGSRGEEVRKIQTKLKQWGYYNGAIDGVYGYQTYRAVRYFQSKNGLTVDGIAGPGTLAAIGISSTNSTSSNNSNLLARLINAEAKGEPYTGQVAVGAVVLNRLKNPNFPNTIAGIIYQPGAFTPVSNGQINASPNESAQKAAQDALNGWDPSGGAIYFFNPATSTSRWIWSRPIVKVIGKHYFAK
jgi:N-acetylmuramoyl-L-alanine amidase